MREIRKTGKVLQNINSTELLQGVYQTGQLLQGVLGDKARSCRAYSNREGAAEGITRQGSCCRVNNTG